MCIFDNLRCTHVVFLSSWKQIVDSVIALFRVDFSGRGELAERQVFSSTHSMAVTPCKNVEGFHSICVIMCVCCEIAAKASTDAVSPYQDC
jgi:hypothetical protein